MSKYENKSENQAHFFLNYSGHIAGLEVRLWRPCQCGAPTAVIETNSGLARLECSRCENYRGWLSAEVCRFISTIVAEFGKPDTPIIINPRDPRVSVDKPVV